MSSKVELQRKLKEIGYEIGPYASKETLSNVMRLHTLTDEDKGINVAKLSDHDLRKSLVENGLPVGPVTNHTRSIYQRKLLEALTNESTEGQEDIIDIELPTSTTPPTRATRSSIIRTEDNLVSSSPARPVLSELPEPRIPLNRVEIDDRNSRNLSAYYPNVTSSKSKTEETITNTYSSQRSSTKPEPRNSAVSYGLRNPYDFQNDEPVIIRHEHKATPFRTANVGADEAFPTSSSSRLGKPIDVQTLARNDFNEIRSRIFPAATEPKELNVASKKPTFTSEPEVKKPVQYESKSDVAVAKNGSTFLYGGITVGVALIVFVLYLYFGE